MVDRPVGEEMTGGEAGVAGAYDDGGEVFDGANVTRLRR
jgi:hypothetical protein